METHSTPEAEDTRKPITVAEEATEVRERVEEVTIGAEVERAFEAIEDEGHEEEEDDR